MWPERFYQLETPADIAHNLRQDRRASTRQHPQGHIWARPHDAQKFRQGKVGRNRLVAFPGILEQGESIAQWRAFANRKEEILRHACLLLNQRQNLWHAQLTRRGCGVLRVSIYLEAAKG